MTAGKEFTLKVRTGPVVWHMSERYERKLKKWLSVHFPGILENQNYLIKDDSTSRVAVADGFVIKGINIKKGCFKWFPSLRRSRSKKAFCIGQILIDHGVPAARHVAWGTHRRFSFLLADYLISEEIKGGTLLKELLQAQSIDRSTRSAVLCGLGELLAGFHVAGFSNRDLKDGNIMVVRQPERMQLRVLDLDGVRRRWRLWRGQVRRDFWPILHSLSVYGWDAQADTEQLLNAYNCKAPVAIRLNELPTVIVSYTRATHAGWQETRILSRMSGLKRQYINVYTPPAGYEWVNIAHRYWRGRLNGLSAVSSSPEATVDCGRVDDNAKSYYFKQFLMRDRWDYIKHILRGSRARRAFQGGRLAEAKGFRVPKIVCIIEEREFFRVRRSGLIAEAIEAPKLHDILQRFTGAKEAGDSKRKRELIRELGLEVGRWHAAHLCHGDMRAGNILCREDQGCFTFWWLDNERTRRTSAFRERARNLVQLNMAPPHLVSTSDRLRFWRFYSQTAPGGHVELQRLRNFVARWTGKRWEKKGWLQR